MSELPVAERREAQAKTSDWFGILLGAATFLFGIALLVFTFIQASGLFSQPASSRVGAAPNADITEIGISAADVVLKIGLLLVMSIVGSVISGKGVRMYIAARSGQPVEKR